MYFLCFYTGLCFGEDPIFSHLHEIITPASLLLFTLSVFLCLFLSSQNYNKNLIFVLHPTSYCAFKSHLISLLFWVCSYEIHQWLLLNPVVLNLFCLSVAFDIVDQILFLETLSPHGSLYATIPWFVFQLIGSIVSVSVADFFLFLKPLNLGVFQHSIQGSLLSLHLLPW